MVKTTADADAVTALTTQRSRSNSAIVARNPDAAAAYLAPYATVLASTGEQVRGAMGMRDIFERMFAEAGFEALARHITDLTIDGPHAAEEGRWEAKWSSHTASGRYMARWRKAPEGWLADAELYIRLSVQE